MHQSIKKKETILFVVLGGFFVANALLAEFIGVKIFSLEKSLGFSPGNWELFGVEDLSFNLTAGVLLWPIVFVMTDIINEYFGEKGVKFLSYLAVGLITYAFIISYVAIQLVPADFWTQSHLIGLEGESLNSAQEEVGNYNSAFELVFGQGLWIIIGSLVAFLIGQIVDVDVFHRIKEMTGEKSVWLRATGSTLVSQLIDSFVVLFIAFYVGANWSLSMVLAVGVVNYVYKFTMAIILTPVIYLAHYIIDMYLGDKISQELRESAMKN